MTVVFISAFFTALALHIPYVVHAAFRAYRDHIRLVRSSNHRELLFLASHMPAHGGSLPARGQASQMGQGAPFKVCNQTGLETSETIEWGFAFDRCPQCGLVETTSCKGKAVQHEANQGALCKI